MPNDMEQLEQVYKVMDSALEQYVVYTESLLWVRNNA